MEGGGEGETDEEVQAGGGAEGEAGGVFSLLFEASAPDLPGK